VISLGIAGSLAPDVPLGQVVLARASVSAEEGLLTPDGFQTCAQIGFPLGPFEGNTVLPDPTLFQDLWSFVERRNGRAGVIATVSTCSGTDEGARTVAARTGAIAEAMEGAAVGQATSRLGAMHARRAAAFAELRVISNTTGDRPAQRWDMKLAIRTLTEAASELSTELVR
jgi:futalosine hydrolase